MFTNTENFGGNFKNVLKQEFKTSKNIVVASGYASADVLKEFKNEFILIAENGGSAKLLLGMAFYEGLSQTKLDILNSLCIDLNKLNKNSGVYVTYTRKYHGKVYLFDNGTQDNIFVGSSNFSSSGTSGNIECTVSVNDTSTKSKVKDFLSYLLSEENSVSILKADIVVPGSKKYKEKISLVTLDNLKQYDPTSIDISKLPQFIYPLDRIAEKEKSSLNVYFGKGRLNTKTGHIKPRPWYEIELIANVKLSSNPLYPKGDFDAYTDDGYIIPMRTQGDYHKNIRSKKSLQIFGMWIKGKLQKAGALIPLTPVTNDTLMTYGNDTLTFAKIADGKYYMKF
ncbi:MAG: NgoFVII family restriction endonuclease [Flavobacterium sp.]|uniref:restriction endonuclease PLD domain-containing protein n=1 Tax=Flavobacterium sp. TaxID=239 RepID=UPI002607FB6A|nr:restriction endonuclease PLD domain-containing protein [Flavobacterium sp.]MDD5150954.1 NgoFVII family restriction endonuclease [Flavobacterium sp.]